ncbi:hypothetical protein [Pseudomonas costantinii]|nr:hypothetical protein [Pseudomonas costantinii]
MNEAKPIDPQELVKWLVALSRAIHPDRSHALRGNAAQDALRPL